MFTRLLLVAILLDVFTISLQGLLPFPPKYRNQQLTKPRYIKNWQNLLSNRMSRQDYEKINDDQFVIQNLYSQGDDDDYHDNDIVLVVDKNYLKSKNQFNYEPESEHEGSQNAVKNLLCKIAGDCGYQDTKLKCDCKKRRNMFRCECAGRGYDVEEEYKQSDSYYRKRGKTLEELLNTPEEGLKDTKSTMRCGCTKQYGYEGLRCGCKNKLRNGDLQTSLGDNYMQDILNAVQRDISNHETYSRTKEPDQIEELRCGCNNRYADELRCGCRGTLRIIEKFDDREESFDSDDEGRNYNQYSTNYKAIPNQVQTVYLNSDFNNDDSKPKLNFLHRSLNEKVQNYGVPFEFDIQGMGQLDN